MLICECLATRCNLGDLRPRGGAVSARSPKEPSASSHGRNRATFPCDIHGDFEVFQIADLDGNHAVDGADLTQLLQGSGQLPIMSCGSSGR